MVRDQILDADLLSIWVLIEIAAAIYYFGNRKSNKGQLMLAPVAIAGLIQGGIGLAQSVVGGIQKLKASKMAKQNKAAVLEDNPYIDDQYALTANYASQGLSEGAKQAMITNSDRQFSAGITDLLRAGGNLNNIGDLYEGNQAALRALALVEAYIQYGLQAKANEDRDQFMLNKWVPQRDTAQLIAELSKNGMTNLWKGIDTMGSGAIKYLDATAK
jgi:hypothetical protein